MSTIKIWNRRLARMETEKVYGESGLRLLYGNWLGLRLTEAVLKHPWVSRTYGTTQSASASRAKIDRFVKKFGVDLSDFEEGPFDSFNSFFIRRFKQGRREFCQEPFRLPSPAEGRVLAMKSTPRDAQAMIKGISVSPLGMIGDPAWARVFEGGPCMILRLCPTDYHRFHFPDDGRVVQSWQAGKGLHSVNPAALEVSGDILLRNHRVITILDTRHFGRLAMIEVGALLVGKIVQTHQTTQPFLRGEEKGYFLFGGSTVVIYGQPDAWTPDIDILEKTAQGVETLVQLGDPIGRLAEYDSKAER